jgi:hypothetical protein
VEREGGSMKGRTARRRAAFRWHERYRREGLTVSWQVCVGNRRYRKGLKMAFRRSHGMDPDEIFGGRRWRGKHVG